MSSEQRLLGSNVATERDQVFGIVIVLAAALIALTSVDSVMVLVQRTGLPTPVRLFFIHYGDLAFLPAAVWVGWTSRSLRNWRFLPMLAGFASAYLMLTESRGSWVWGGTFDQADHSTLPWMRAGLIGAALAMVVGGLPFKVQPDTDSVSRFLAALAVALVLAVMMPRLLVVDSEFVSTRWIFIAVFLISLLIVYFIQLRTDS